MPWLGPSRTMGSVVLSLGWAPVVRQLVPSIRRYSPESFQWPSQLDVLLLLVPLGVILEALRGPAGHHSRLAADLRRGRGQSLGQNHPLQDWSVVEVVAQV